MLQYYSRIIAFVHKRIIIMSLKTLKASISGTRFSTRNVGPNVMNRIVVAAMSPNVETDAADVDVGVEVFSGKLNTIDEFYVVLSDCISHEEE